MFVLLPKRPPVDGAERPLLVGVEDVFPNIDVAGLLLFPNRPPGAAPPPPPAPNIPVDRTGVELVPAGVLPKRPPPPELDGCANKPPPAGWLAPVVPGPNENGEPVVAVVAPKRPPEAGAVVAGLEAPLELAPVPNVNDIVPFYVQNSWSESRDHSALPSGM